MMYELLIRLFVTKENKIVETIFDKRLSYSENLILFNKMIENMTFHDFHVYDPIKRIFIDKNKVLDDMGVYSFMTFYLY